MENKFSADRYISALELKIQKSLKKTHLNKADMCPSLYLTEDQLNDYCSILNITPDKESGFTMIHKDDAQRIVIEVINGELLSYAKQLIVPDLHCDEVNEFYHSHENELSLKYKSIERCTFNQLYRKGFEKFMETMTNDLGYKPCNQLY